MYGGEAMAPTGGMMITLIQMPMPSTSNDKRLYKGPENNLKDEPKSPL